jgi:TolA-binding protein
LNSLTQPVVSKNAIQQKQSLAPNPPAELKSSPSMQTSLPVRTIQPFANNSTSSQKQYEVAIRSYRNGDCQMAIQQFTKFLAENTSSILAADASLFIADCYLRLSGK